MYHTIDEFIADWREESARTARVIEALNDQSLKYEIVPGDRTIGFIAWHIATTLAEMPAHVGLRIKSVDPESPPPARAAEIGATYRAAAGELADAVRRDWTDATLKAEDEIYGMKWTRATTMEMLVRHEIHHRAQLMTLMRQAGVKVPGVYGPSKDDLAAGGDKKD